VVWAAFQIFLNAEKDCRFPKHRGVLLCLLMRWLDVVGPMFVAEEQIQKDPTKAHLLVCRDMGNTDLNLCK
jgi:hypothetical protein